MDKHENGLGLDNWGAIIRKIFNPKGDESPRWKKIHDPGRS
jgi:hypothetical protein